MEPLNRSRRLVRRFTLPFSALFVLALATAQPHRVHHFFEAFDHQHRHVDTDSNHDDHSKVPTKAPQTECVVQAVSQHCSAIPVAIAKVPIVATAGEVCRPALSRWIYHFSLSPFLQRAPPASSPFYRIYTDSLAERIHGVLQASPNFSTSHVTCQSYLSGVLLQLRFLL